MRNSLGNPARGDAFFERTKEVKKIYRVLSGGTSIYLSAPRRVGKTSILKYLEESPEDNFHFIYIITESTDSSNDFFKIIFEELVKSDAIQRLTKITTAFKDAITGLLGRVKSIEKIELREVEEPDYFEMLTELFSHVKPEHGRVVLMIDEFPQTIQNIINKDGNKLAENFILKNRDLRHHSHLHDKVSFIYTGSVSLFPIVEKVTELTSINDLRTVPVEPLDFADGRKFIKRLMENEVAISDELIDYMLNKVGWLIPFHLQLIQQEVLDVYESTGKIDHQSIDLAYEQIVHSRNKPQFEPYFARLKKIFKDSEYEFVMDILQYIALNDTIDNNVLSDKAVKYNITETKSIIDILDGDGYVVKENEKFRYTSPILQLWCKKHICK